MKVRVGANGHLRTVVDKSLTAEPTKGEDLRVDLEDLDPRSGIKSIQVGEAKNDGGIFLVLSFDGGDNETLWLNKSQVRRCATSQKILFTSKEAELSKGDCLGRHCID